jgi:hypothetical protein
VDALDTLLAHREIADVIGRYCMLFDDQDWDGLVQLWTDDAAFVVDGPSSPEMVFEGRDRVIEFLRNCLPHGYASKHMIAPPVIDLASDGSSAVARTDVVWISGAFENTIVARYHDDLVACDGRWLIRRRREVPMQYTPGAPPMSGTATAASAATMRR